MFYRWYPNSYSQWDLEGYTEISDLHADKKECLEELAAAKNAITDCWVFNVEVIIRLMEERLEILQKMRDKPLEVTPRVIKRLQQITRIINTYEEFK